MQEDLPARAKRLLVWFKDNGHDEIGAIVIMMFLFSSYIAEHASDQDDADLGLTMLTQDLRMTVNKLMQQKQGGSARKRGDDTLH